MSVSSLNENVKLLYQAIKQELAAQLQFLPDKPEETLDSTAHALWHAAAGEPMSAALALQTSLSSLNTNQQLQLQKLIQQRLDGTPLSHLTGRQHFMGLEMLATPEALVPRRETELLARTAIELAQEMGSQQPQVKVVDVCTGSGNVALAIAKHVVNAQIYAADLSADAVALAQRNAAHLQLASRMEFRAGDLLAPFDTPEFLGQVDVLTCNPPYISSAKVEQMHTEISAHEPHLAFDGGPFGIAILMRLLQEAPRFVRSGGWLAFEVGLGQGPAMYKRLVKNPTFVQVRMLQDAAGDVRVIAARLA
jgi:release factor glutamine methyltransferase